jgi:hypothetical protein
MWMHLQEDQNRKSTAEVSDVGSSSRYIWREAIRRKWYRRAGRDCQRELLLTSEDAFSAAEGDNDRSTSTNDLP